MLTKDDANRIADAITVLRGTWHRNQLIAVMGRDTIRLRRQPKDVAAALAWVAMDADTREPTRILETGPWWGTGTPTKTERNTSAHIRTAHPADCDICGRPEADHRPGWVEDHPYRMRNHSGHGTRAPEDIRTQLADITHNQQQEEA